MKPSLRGNHLPESYEDFIDPAYDMRFYKCVTCGSLFSGENTKTAAGWRETQISGF